MTQHPQPSAEALREAILCDGPLRANVADAIRAELPGCLDTSGALIVAETAIRHVAQMAALAAPGEVGDAKLRAAAEEVKRTRDNYKRAKDGTVWDHHLNHVMAVERLCELVATPAPGGGGDAEKVAELHGYLDDWMKLLGTGINGHQAEATMLVDHALRQLVELRKARKPNADVIALILHEDAMADAGKLTNGDYLAVKIADTFDPPNARPAAWMRGHCTPSSPDGPAEYDIDFVYGDDQPDGDGWQALYARAHPPGGAQSGGVRRGLYWHGIEDAAKIAERAGFKDVAEDIRRSATPPAAAEVQR